MKFKKNNIDLLFELKEYTLFEESDLKIDGVGKQFLEQLSNKPYHIYCIVKKPRVKYNPERVHLSTRCILIPFDIYTSSGIKSVDIPMKNTSNSLNVHIDFDGCNEFIQIQMAGKWSPKIKASCLLDEFNREKSDQLEVLDYELLYVGKSFSSKGKKNVVSRLFGHEVIQNIYSDTLKMDPFSSIWFMVCDFHYYANISTLPSESPFNRTEFKNELSKGLSIKGDEKQKLVEASIINYFKPKYNKTFKDIFPSRKHASYSTAYRAELNKITVEFGITDLGRSIYTENIKRSPLHIYEYKF